MFIDVNLTATARERKGAFAHHHQEGALTQLRAPQIRAKVSIGEFGGFLYAAGGAG
jgi:hypothetical protein